jgi:hypothetical protein
MIVCICQIHIFMLNIIFLSQSTLQFKLDWPRGVLVGRECTYREIEDKCFVSWD